MAFGRVNPQFQLEDQGITGLDNVYYNLMDPALVQEALSRGEGSLGFRKPAWRSGAGIGFADRD